MYTEIPAVEGTALTRIAALEAARQLLKEEPATSKASMFGGETHSPGSVAGPSALIRLATYIETGHDYKDTHPVGKRRPKVINVTVHAHGIPDVDDIEHLLHHFENGDFNQPEPDEEETEADVADKVEDEPEHEPQVDGDRPRFNR